MIDKENLKLIIDDTESTDEEKLEELIQMGYELEDILDFILKNY